jgi:hypothetical protein
MKRCPRCGTVKGLEAFGARRHGPTGRKSWCRDCEASAQRERYRHLVDRRVCVDCRTATPGGVVCPPCAVRRAEGRCGRRLPAAAAARPQGLEARPAPPP